MPDLRISSSRFRSPSMGTSRPSMVTKDGFGLTMSYIPSMAPSLQNLGTGAALDAQPSVDVMHHFLFSGNGIDGADPLAHPAGRLHLAKLISGFRSALQRPAGQRFSKTWASYSSRKCFRVDRTGVGRRFTEAAQGALLDRRAELLHEIEGFPR